LLKQIGTDPSHFLSGISRGLSNAARLLSRSLPDPARLRSSVLAGTRGCIFKPLGRFVFLVWLCHFVVLPMSVGLLLCESELLALQRGRWKTVPGPLIFSGIGNGA
jgi:hypothetical protein